MNGKPIVTARQHWALGTDRTKNNEIITTQMLKEMSKQVITTCAAYICVKTQTYFQLM